MDLQGTALALGQAGTEAAATSATATAKPMPELITNPEPVPCPLSPTCPAAAPPEEPQFGYDGGLSLRTKDKKFSLVVNGFAQLLYVLTAPPGASISQTFHLGLGRLAFSGNVFSPKFSYFLQFEASTFGNNNLMTMLDWNMTYTVNKYFSIQAGRFIVPFSRQFYTHPGNLLFADLSPAEYDFNFNRAIGIHVGGSVSRLSYDAYLVNSIRPIGVGTQVNRGDQIAGGARLELAILAPYGYMETMPKAPDKAQFSIGAAVAYNPVADDSAFNNLQKNDDTVTFTTDLGFRWRRVSLQAALYMRHLTNQDLPNDFGFYGQFGVYLIRERLELAARVSGTLLSNRAAVAGLTNLVNPNYGIAGNAVEYTTGLNAYLFGHGAKLQTDYTAIGLAGFIGTTPFDVSTLFVNTPITHRFRVQLQLLF